MEDNEDEPDDVKNATPVKDEVKSGERDEKAGDPKATRKKKEGNKPSRCEKNENKPKAVVKLEGERCRNKIYKPLKASETMSVLIYSPACGFPRMEIIPRHCLSKKEYIDVLAKPSRRCPDSCLNGKTVIRKVRPISARINELSQPARRLIVGTLQERGETLPPEMISNLVKSIEGSACLTPEQAENYFRDTKRVKERKAGLGKCVKKRCKQEKGKSPCPSGLDKEAVICQYLMAERFVKSILEWKCPIPVEEFQDIATVILRRLSFVLEYTPLGEQEDLKSQQMRLLADIVACWISGVLFEVAEDHKKELEEDKLQSEEDEDEETEEEEEEEEEESLKPGKEVDEEEGEEEIEEKFGEDGKGNKEIIPKDLKKDETKESETKEEEPKIDSEVPEEPIGYPGIVKTEPKEPSPEIEDTVKVKEELPDREKEEKEAEEKARREEEERRRQQEEEAERARREAEEMKKKQKEMEEAAAEAARLEEEKKKKKKEAEEMAAAEEEEKRKKKEAEEEEKKKKKEAEETAAAEEEKKKKKQKEEEEKEEKKKREEEEEERRRKEEEVEKNKKKKQEEEKLKEVGPGTAIDGIGEGDLFKSELPFITFGKIIDTMYEMVSDSSEIEETDPVQNRIQRAIYEKLFRLVELESPESLTENLKDVIDVTSGKIASWLKELLKDTETQFMVAHPPEVESKEIRDWGKWIDQVADRAVDWADWIHRVVKEAEGKSVGPVNRGEWVNWTGDTDTNALLWRRYYLETVHQAHHNKMMMADRPLVKTGQKGKGVRSSGAIITEKEITNTDLE